MSEFQDLGLSLNVYAPDIDVDTPLYTPASNLFADLSLFVTGYEHVIQANGGFWSASIVINDTKENVEKWIQEGLNKHVEVMNPALDFVWVGFVNEVKATVGDQVIRRGPLMDVGNRVSVVYAPILDNTVNPPVIGARTVTTIADGDASRAVYGVLEDVRSGGTTLQAIAEQHRDTYLAEMQWPQTSGEVVTSGGQPASITLDCLGYIHRFKKYILSDTTTGVSTISSQTAPLGKLQDVIAADPNGLFSENWVQMEENLGLSPTTWDDDERPAFDVITGLVAPGDINDARFTFGVYENQLIYYAAAPTEIEYHHYITDSGQRIETISGAEVAPYDVRAAKWLMFPDFLPGLSVPADLREDPRLMFVESVTFSLPWDLQINGVKISTLPQFLAKHGMGGSF